MIPSLRQTKRPRSGDASDKRRLASPRRQRPTDPRIFAKSLTTERTSANCAGTKQKRHESDDMQPHASHAPPFAARELPPLMTRVIPTSAGPNQASTAPSPLAREMPPAFQRTHGTTSQLPARQLHAACMSDYAGASASCPLVAPSAAVRQLPDFAEHRTTGPARHSVSSASTASKRPLPPLDDAALGAFSPPIRPLGSDRI